MSQKVKEPQKVMNEQLNERLPTENREENIHKKWESIKNVTIEVTENILGKQTSPNKRECFDDQCKKVVDERNEAHKSYLSRSTGAKRLEYEELRRKADKICRKKKRVENNEHVKETENLTRLEIRKAYKEINNRKTGFRPHTNLCNDKNGNIIAEQEQITSRWKECFEELLNPPTTKHEAEVRIEEDNIIIEPPKLVETKMALQAVKFDTATGIDSVPPEVYKAGGEFLKIQIHKVTVKISETEVIPKEWYNIILCAIFKVTNLTVKNYRGISLLHTAYKIFTNILTNSL
jgi:hypothetical protein